MIKVNQNVFELYNKNIKYVFQVLENGELNHLYFGKKIDIIDHELLQPKIHRSVFSFSGNDSTESMDYKKNEFPSNFNNDFGNSAISVNFDGSNYSHFIFSHYENNEKEDEYNSLLPHFEKSDFESISIYLKEKTTDIYLKLIYYISEKYDTLIRRSEVINKTNKEISVNRLYSSSIDFSDSQYKLCHYAGTWLRERQLLEENIEQGLKKMYSRYGCSSAFTNPFFMLKEIDTTEYHGNCYSFNLVHSGNFENIVEKTSYNRLRIQQGIYSGDFSEILNPGSVFYSPEAILTFSNKGVNGLSNENHNIIRDCLLPYKRIDNDVLINNWEATYFDFTEDKLLDLATDAAKVGINLFVLDDGWFGKRDDDFTSLGDWKLYKEKIPSGLEKLCGNINEKGLKFGIWIEPEMVNPESEFFNNNICKIMGKKGYDSYLGRNQHVLDFSDFDIVDYIYDSIFNSLKNCNIEYIKWDFNRYITHQTNGKYKNSHNYHYMLGVYRFYNNLKRDFPNAVVEGCASGGGRFDLGILYFSPQIWLSDNTDANCRVYNQYNTSIAYPICTFGSHVANSPSHQLNRVISLVTRGNVAYFGSFGYELDVTKISQEEKDTIEKQILFFKKNANIIKSGKFHRLAYKNEYSPFFAWSCEKNGNSIVMIYLELLQPNMPIYSIKFPYLEESKIYEVMGVKYHGSYLINRGLSIDCFYSGNNMDNLVHFEQEEYLYEKFTKDFSSIVFEINEFNE